MTEHFDPLWRAIQHSLHLIVVCCIVVVVLVVFYLALRYVDRRRGRGGQAWLDPHGYPVGAMGVL